MVARLTGYDRPAFRHIPSGAPPGRKGKPPKGLHERCKLSCGAVSPGAAFRSGEQRPGKTAFPAPFQGASAPPAAAFRGRRRGRPERTARCTFAAGARVWPPAGTPLPFGEDKGPRSASPGWAPRTPDPGWAPRTPDPDLICVPPSPIPRRGKAFQAGASRGRWGIAAGPRRRGGRPRRRPGDKTPPRQDRPAPKAAGAGAASRLAPKGNIPEELCHRPPGREKIEACGPPSPRGPPIAAAIAIPIPIPTPIPIPMETPPDLQPTAQPG